MASEPDPTLSEMFGSSVRLLSENGPLTVIAVGDVALSETSCEPNGTPSGFQFAASPQFVVAAPPSQVLESVTVLARSKKTSGARAIATLEVTVPPDWSPV